MGGCNFSTIASGATIADAFADAKEHAYWEYGHGGYSGTIAEKPGFVEIVKPDSLSSAELDRLLITTYDPEEIAVLAVALGVPLSRAEQIVAQWSSKWDACIGWRDGDEFFFSGMASC